MSRRDAENARFKHQIQQVGDWLTDPDFWYIDGSEKYFSCNYFGETILWSERDLLAEKVYPPAGIVKTSPKKRKANLENSVSSKKSKTVVQVHVEGAAAATAIVSKPSKNKRPVSSSSSSNSSSIAASASQPKTKPVVADDDDESDDDNDGPDIHELRRRGEIQLGKQCHAEFLAVTGIHVLRTIRNLTLTDEQKFTDSPTKKKLRNHRGICQFADCPIKEASTFCYGCSTPFDANQIHINNHLHHICNDHYLSHIALMCSRALRKILRKDYYVIRK